MSNCYILRYMPAVVSTNPLKKRDWRPILGSIFMLVVLTCAVVAGVVLVQREQDIRNRASSGSGCQQSPDCVLLDGSDIDGKNSGDYNATRNIAYLDITNKPGEEVRFEKGDNDNGCYRGSIQGSSANWERYREGNDCKEISNVQIWLETQVEPSPSEDPTEAPSEASSPTSTSTPTESPTDQASVPPIFYGCPLTATGDQILVDFDTARLRTFSESTGVKGPFNVSIPAGTYKVTLASSDSHDSSDETQPREQYFVEFLAETALVASSNSIGDLPDDQTNLTQVVNSNLSLSAGVNNLFVRHSAIGSSNPNSINAECMLLEPQEVVITAQCFEAKVFDTDWNRILPEDYDTLLPGDVIRFSVGGSTTDGNFTKARFVVNGETQPETTLFRPGTDEYYAEYIIPEDIDQLTVKGELFHSILGWI